MHVIVMLRSILGRVYISEVSTPQVKLYMHLKMLPHDISVEGKTDLVSSLYSHKS